MPVRGCERDRRRVGGDECSAQEEEAEEVIPLPTIEEEEEQERLTEEEFNNLPVQSILEPLDRECAICIDKFEKGAEVIKLDCNHLFHKNCIKSYFLNYNNKCPMCRNQIN